MMEDQPKDPLKKNFVEPFIKDSLSLDKSDALLDVAVANSSYIEELYGRYHQNAQELDAEWQDLFSACERSEGASLQKTLQTAVSLRTLIDAYRTYGHLKAKIDPLEHPIEEHPWQLDLQQLGFNVDDLHRIFPTAKFLDASEAPLSEIIKALETIYCNKVGIEYMNGENPEIEKWLQAQIEPKGFEGKLSIDQKKMALHYLNKSELFEIFLHTKYTGQKRFSLEGGETLIPMLGAIIDRGAEGSIRDFQIGMAHRGRLNVLANILEKSYSKIFQEFSENYIPESFEQSGDVKYHKGFFSESMSSHGHKINISLTPNPSHLEAVDPVILGQVYAKQLLAGLPEGRKKILPILIHGDAAIAGQGVVYEALQLQALDGYQTGGTLHIVINNQIGFTTIPQDCRSTHYCTDISRTFGIPVFHINAEDVEGAIFCTYLALEMRQKFQCDVILDLVCYRKYGHNEGDEPAYTQPLEYQKISKKKSIRELYRDQLIQEGVLEKKVSEELESDFKTSLQKQLQILKDLPKVTGDALEEPLKPKEILFPRIQTGVSRQVLEQICEAVCYAPEGFSLHPKLEKLFLGRLEAIKGDATAKAIDWGTAEMLAFGSLLWEGYGVRLSGQDSCRGTFSHRHGVWMDQKTESPYIPLKHLKGGQGSFEIYNSSLSEYAVLGFELGYSIAIPSSLVLWEAQFGDFCNGAQVIIDQFISTGEQKWGQQSGLVMLLPHGYEGQGPEHSSARMERFITLTGENNIQLANVSTPAQFFHLLRRQQLRKEKKPLIIFTPKALLRHPACTSPLSEFEMGTFQEVLDDPKAIDNVRKIVFCSGHIYYDLVTERDRIQADDVVILRVEQLYPFHVERIKELLQKYSTCTQIDWVQEEPKNMGAALYMLENLRPIVSASMILNLIARPQSASPAVGSFALHKKQLEDILKATFGERKLSIFEMAAKKN